VSGPATATTGSPFVVEIVVDGAQDLGGFEFDLVYDPTMLQVQQVESGPFLASSGRTVALLGPAIDQSAGKAAFGLYSQGTGAGASGGGVLARVTMMAIGPGRSALDLQTALLADPAGTLSLPTAQDGSIDLFGPPLGGMRLFLPTVAR
jgi:hypothetical protein